MALRRTCTSEHLEGLSQVDTELVIQDFSSDQIRVGLVKPVVCSPSCSEHLHTLKLKTTVMVGDIMAR